MVKIDSMIEVPINVVLTYVNFVISTSIQRYVQMGYYIGKKLKVTRTALTFPRPEQKLDYLAGYRSEIPTLDHFSGISKRLINCDQTRSKQAVHIGVSILSNVWVGINIQIKFDLLWRKNFLQYPEWKQHTCTIMTSTELNLTHNQTSLTDSLLTTYLFGR